MERIIRAAFVTRVEHRSTEVQSLAQRCVEREVHFIFGARKRMRAAWCVRDLELCVITVAIVTHVRTPPHPVSIQKAPVSRLASERKCADGIRTRLHTK